MIRKKVLHIGQDTGGVKTYIAQTFEHSSDMYEFSIIAPANKTFQAYCKKKSINYYPVDLHRGGNPLKTLIGISKIIRIIHKEDPDIIHTHSAKGGFLGRLAGKLTASKNVIYTPHAFSYLSFSGPKRMAFYLLETMAVKWTSVLLAISYSEANKAIHELGYKKRDVKMVLNSVELPGTDRLVPANQNLKIRLIGRLTVQKNQIQFLEIANQVLKKHPAIQFSILGAGIHDDQSPEINKYLQKHDLTGKINIEKWGDAGKSRKFLEDTDIYVMTSLFEGLPYSLLEAMALGIPCVVSDVEGNKDVIRNYENGFSCLTVESFCEKIELLINNPELRERIGNAGRQYVEKHHNIATNKILLERVYRELPGRHAEKEYIDDHTPGELQVQM